MFSHNNKKHDELLTLPRSWDDLIKSEKFAEGSQKPGFWRDMLLQYVSSNPPEDDQKCEQMFRKFWQQYATVLINPTVGLAHAVDNNYDVYIRNWFCKIPENERENIVNMQARHSDAVLHLAAQRGYVDIVRMLHEAGADINAKGSMSDTALQRAIAAGKTEVALCLIDAGVDVKEIRMDGECAIHLAVMVQLPEVVDALLSRDKSQISYLGRSGRSPLFHAVMNNDVAMVDKLIGYGADVNEICNFDGFAPLHYAAIKDKPAMVECLIKHGATVDLKDRSGYTPLQRCALQECPSVKAAEMLIASKANVNLGEKPPIYLLAAKASQRVPQTLAMAKMLVERGADVHAEVDGKSACEVLKHAKSKKWLKKDELGLHDYLAGLPKAKSKGSSLFNWARKK